RDGDGELELPPGCDDLNGLGACRSDCVRASCGNGLLDAGEACDDGNLLPGDGCRPDCASDETCGNGELDFFAGEQCDDGDLRGRDGCDAGCVTEALRWRRRGLPAGRKRAAIAYDSARARVVVFGGATSDGTRLGDTWEWDGDLWTDVTPATGPTPREGAAMAYHAARMRVVLFGGRDDTRVRDDTWEWDGATWSERSTSVAPLAVTEHAMAYDAARRRTMLFGGDRGNGSIADTWEWDGDAWHPLAPLVEPPRRAGHALAYDPIHARTVMFGGRGAVTELADTWLWDGTTWSALSAAGPRPRRGGALALEPATGELILFGGCVEDPDSPGDFYDERETWGLSATAWTRRGDGSEPTISQPCEVAMTSDLARRRLVMLEPRIRRRHPRRRSGTEPAGA
ncbi:MAG: kelch repeat-containing protein, partial [Kofleriaceae bacterium]